MPVKKNGTPIDHTGEALVAADRSGQRRQQLGTVYEDITRRAERTELERVAAQPTDAATETAIAEFLAGNSKAGLACLGDAAGTMFWGPIAQPAVDALVREFDSAGTSASTRMLATIAGQSFADWAYLTGVVRAVDQHRKTPGEDQYLRDTVRRQKEYADRTQACLEALRGQHPSNVRLTVGSAANINLGTQTAVPSHVDSTRRPRTK